MSAIQLLWLSYSPDSLFFKKCCSVVNLYIVYFISSQTKMSVWTTHVFMVGLAGTPLGHLGAHVPRAGLGRYVKMVRFSLTRTFSTHEILSYKNMYFRNNIYFHLIETTISPLIFSNIHVYSVGKVFSNSFHLFLPLLIDVNECLRNPCIHGGVCRNTNGSYVCECPEQYTGKNCELGKVTTNFKNEME